MIFLITQRYYLQHICFLFELKAYPEYLVTYQIMKPEENSSANEDSSRWWNSNTRPEFISGRYCKNKINYFIITPAVCIDESYIKGKQSAQCITKKNWVETQNSTHIRVPLILNDNRKQSLQTFAKSSVSRHWCALFCSAIKCLGIQFSFTATSAVFNINGSTHKQPTKNVFSDYQNK